MAGFGVDLHPENQPNFNARLAASHGVQFAAVKSSQGTSYVPRGLHEYFSRLDEQISLMLFYHFLEGGETGGNQAEHFLEVTEQNGGVQGRGIVVDFEDYGNRDPSNQQLFDFTAMVKRETNRHPVIAYSTRTFWNGGDPSGPLSQYDLDAAWEARVWTRTEHRENPQRFYHDSWLPWYVNLTDRGFGGVAWPLLRQFTWGGYFGGLYVDSDACTNMDRLRSLA